MKQETKQHGRRRGTAGTADVTPDYKDNLVSSQAADVLDDIECCLAEAEEEQKALKQKARKEWAGAYLQAGELPVLDAIAEGIRDGRR